jgi:para-nitrobenzyl esterase
LRLAVACSLLFLSNAVPGCAGTGTHSPTLVSLPQGRLQGTIDAQSVWVYKGVPFAKPPVGPLRWAPPEPPDSWGSHIRDATEYGAMCVQVDMKGPDFRRAVGDEDCLTLNIWTPSVGAKAMRPVLVFLHGGGHMSGSSSGAESTGVPWYIGSNLARQGPAVVVTVAYRVGALGFMGHRALSRASGYGGSGNYGHMDQIRALEWVRDNIAHFGGDPKRVMLFGQSAGGTSTLVLLASPRARGLFQRAIIHSMTPFTLTLADAESKGAMVERNLGCSNTDADKALACMRSKRADQVTLAVSNDLVMGGSGVLFGPSVDRSLLPDTIMGLLRSGQQSHVPVMVGSTADEFTTLASVMLPRAIETESDYEAAIASYFSAILPLVPAETIRAAYPSRKYSNRLAAMIAIVSDYVYTCPARMVTRTLASTHKAPVRRFLFAHTATSPLWRQYKAAHGFELHYLFGPLAPELGLRLSDAEQALSTQMIRAWLNFADSGTPTAPGLPNWTAYTSDRDNYVVLDTPPSLGHGFRGAQCDFWDRYEPVLYP